MEEPLRDSARQLGARIRSGRWDPPGFRAALACVPPETRDSWVDAALGLGPPPDDGPTLPRGCVPYLPSPVDALLRLTDHLPVRHQDLFVDVGAGVGRAAVLVHLLTGARALGLEVQPPLVAAARGLAADLRLAGVSFVEGDATAELPAAAAEGTVFFLYCPFSGERVTRLLTHLQPLDHLRPLRVACLDMPGLPCAWLQRTDPWWPDLVLYRGGPGPG